MLLLAIGFLGISFASERKRFNDSQGTTKGPGPARVVVLLLLAGAILTVHYFVPANRTRAETLIPVEPKDASEIVLSKESQILFGIRTQEMQPAKIISGVTAIGVARPALNSKVRWWFQCQGARDGVPGG